MEYANLLPCENGRFCGKLFPLSSDFLRVRVNDFAIMDPSYGEASVYKLHPIMKEHGIFNPTTGKYNMSAFQKWIGQKACPYFERLGLKEDIQSHNILIFDQTT